MAGMGGAGNGLHALCDDDASSEQGGDMYRASAYRVTLVHKL